ncbi:pentapeptide repeat-containing protein [Trichocoleus sp. DQ-A3]|uniref:pentapeptide repeat-containing protein n=1 Tax=Cyanophyceae TaxID=3028117 RepID=UPI00168280B5|nr:pentapeptide repeat-containing protein [Coleofasciculus sp. FACHB-125]MBD1903871.1 pentapeptide repeat-containing protein [Coleofasciculus sp. FACHB-125]
MAENNLCRTKKRINYIATLEGIEKAEKALQRIGFDSKYSFANSIKLSRTTITRFFSRKPIQFDSFKRICYGLTFEKWEHIAELAAETEEIKQVEKIQVSPIPSSEEGLQTLQTPARKITVVDANNVIKVVITLQGNINSIDNLKALTAIIKEYSGNTIKIIDVQEGSIKLIIEGSQEDIERLLLQINSGELIEIDGFPIEDIQILNERVEDDESSQQKWRLVEEIRSDSFQGRNLGGADLSDADLSNVKLSHANLINADLSGADLSGADLRGANLSGADLSGADLSGTYLRSAKLDGADLSDADLSDADLSDADLNNARIKNAQFGFNSGISEEMKQNLIKRGAIIWRISR